MVLHNGCALLHVMLHVTFIEAMYFVYLVLGQIDVFSHAPPCYSVLVVLLTSTKALLFNFCNNTHVRIYSRYIHFMYRNIVCITLYMLC